MRLPSKTLIRALSNDNTLGMDSVGRLIIVVHTERDERTRLISARKASPGEAARYYA